jgi:drug/metabolite transporter (DMT)-like permease
MLIKLSIGMEHMEQHQEWKYYFLLLFTSFLWGGNFVAGKFLVGHASPLVLTECAGFWRSLVLSRLFGGKKNAFHFRNMRYCRLFLWG